MATLRDPEFHQSCISHFSSLPKGDLHNHLSLGISRDQLRRAFPEAGLVYPSHYDGLPGMVEFIHQQINPVMSNADRVLQFLELGIESALQDNVRVLEASVDVSLTRFFDHSPETFLHHLGRLGEKYRGVFYPVVGMNKSLPDEVLAEWVPAFVSSGLFFGVDLYGLEADQDLTRFAPLFRECARRHLARKVHIGEFSNGQSVAEAIDLLEPTELQHGIRSVDSPRALAMIKERGIVLHFCPESNVQLGAVPSLQHHPMRQLFDLGIPITVNTDDLVLFGKTISEQLADLAAVGLFTVPELEGLCEGSVSRKAPPPNS